MKKPFLFLCGVIAVSGLFVSSGWSMGTTEPVASVVAVRGLVKASNGEQERRLDIKAEVFQSDIIDTGKGGRLQLLFTDNTIVSLGSQSIMEIAEYKWDAEKQTGAMKTRVEEGTFRVLGGLITQKSPQSFSTETPAATIGIRGSMYAGSFRNNRLEVAFLGGRGIFVRNQYGQVELSRPGFGTQVGVGQAPEPASRVNGMETPGGLVEGLGDDEPGEEQEAGGTAGTGDTAGAGGTGGSSGDSSLSPANAELLNPGTGGTTDNTTVDVAVSLGGEVVVTSTNDTLADSLTNTTTNTTAITGHSLSFLRRLSDGVLVDMAQLGVTATSENGFVTLTLSDGTVLAGFSILPNYNPNAVYADWNFWTEAEPVTATSPIGAIPTDRDIAWDNRGEFFIYEHNYSGNIITLDGQDYLYQSLAFAGTPTPLASLPSTGIDTYFGDVIGQTLSPDPGYATQTLLGDVVMQAAVTGPGFQNSSIILSELSVNWANRKVFGVLYDPLDMMYYYGDLSAGPSSFRFISGESWTWPYDLPGQVSTMSGQMSSMLFYGSEYQGFGFTANGAEQSIVDLAPWSQWQAAGGFFREPGMTLPSPTGVKPWSGFYVGKMTDLAFPDNGWTDLGNFSFNTDAAAGTVTGLFRNLPVGGATRSAYIDDHNFIAEFIPGTYGFDTVLAGGSFLVTAEPWLQFSDYASWGYWNLLGIENGEGLVRYHAHSPGSFWIGGEQTPATAINGLIAANFTGTYSGPAFGTVEDWRSGAVNPMTNGATNLTYNFSNGQINGSIAFDQVTLSINESAALDTASRFNIYSSNLGDFGAIMGTVNGGFFGPNAETMAGNFEAYSSGAQETYSGIYGGNR